MLEFDFRSILSGETIVLYIPKKPDARTLNAQKLASDHHIRDAISRFSIKSDISFPKLMFIIFIIS